MPGCGEFTGTAPSLATAFAVVWRPLRGRNALAPVAAVQTRR